MLLLPLVLLLQSPTEHAILEAEYLRPENVSTLLSGLKSPDARIQRLAVRALGRLERPSLRDSVAPMLRSGDVEVRREAVAALAQMGAAFDFASLLPSRELPIAQSTAWLRSLSSLATTGRQVVVRCVGR